MLLAKSMTGKEVDSLPLHWAWYSKWQVSGINAWQSIGNNVAMETLKIVFPLIRCFSHTLDHVAENMKTPVLNKFMKRWISMSQD